MQDIRDCLVVLQIARRQGGKGEPSDEGVDALAVELHIPRCHLPPPTVNVETPYEPVKGGVTLHSHSGHPTLGCVSPDPPYPHLSPPRAMHREDARENDDGS